MWEEVSQEYFVLAQPYSSRAQKTAPPARKIEKEITKQEKQMKTGRDANRPGSYISECCLTEVAILQGQMFPRCPACFALTHLGIRQRGTWVYRRRWDGIEKH